jgi:cytidylate kinase
MAIVTLARTAGAGGEEVGRAIAERLGYGYYGKKEILKAVGEVGEQWLRWAKEMDERGPSLWERYDQSFAGVVALEESLIYEHALRDRVVIVDRRANWLLRDIPYALRIRIDAPKQKRIDALCEREDVDREAAETLIEESDREKAAYMQAVYGIDYADPSYYDKVYELGKVSLDEVVGQIVGEIPTKDRRATAEARASVQRIALAARVRAALWTDLRLTIPTLEVFHDGGAVVVRGVVSDLEEQKLALDIAYAAAAPAEVRSEFRFRGA